MPETTKKAYRPDTTDERLPKIAQLDSRINGQDRPSAEEIIRFVDEVFKVDLNKMPLLPGHADPSLTPAAAIEVSLQRPQDRPSAADIRGAINEIFGINLDALSALGGKRISLFSKRQWMVRDDSDLFAVRTGDGDADVTVSPTAYLLERLGPGEFPLLEPLTELGFNRNESDGSYYFASPDGNAVADAFKGRTMAAIMNAIRDNYAHL